MRLVFVMAICIAGVMSTLAASAKKKIQSSVGDSQGVISQESSVLQEPMSSRDLYKKVRDKILIVQGDGKVGSGFVCEMDGRRYFITNKHVVEGQSQLVANFPDGRELKFKDFEVAEGDVDLVRFAVKTNQPVVVVRESEPEMDEDVFVFGNSDGAGVVTDLSGKVVGIGADKIEVSAKFVGGNSGSAVFDSRGEVLGVATFATRRIDPQDWLKADSRFAEARRWALRLKNVSWKKMDFKVFNRKIAAEKKKAQEEAGVLPEGSASFKSPKMRINKIFSGNFMVSGDITMSLSGMKNLKNPIVRVAVMVQCGGTRLVRGFILDKPQTMEARNSPPVYGYGMESCGVWNCRNGIGAYYLEGLSYYQQAFDVKSMKGIEYFDRAKLLTGGYFAIPQEILPSSPERNLSVLVFRLECWQNGSLAGVYNSMRPNSLIAKGIPVDWFIVGKYPRLFVY